MLAIEIPSYYTSAVDFQKVVQKLLPSCCPSFIPFQAIFYCHFSHHHQAKGNICRLTIIIWHINGSAMEDQGSLLQSNQKTWWSTDFAGYTFLSQGNQPFRKLIECSDFTLVQQADDWLEINYHPLYCQMISWKLEQFVHLVKMLSLPAGICFQQNNLWYFETFCNCIKHNDYKQNQAIWPFNR